MCVYEATASEKKIKGFCPPLGTAVVKTDTELTTFLLDWIAANVNIGYVATAKMYILHL